MSTQSGGSDADLRKLMERLFLIPRYGVEPFPLVGELPPEWDIPLPLGALIVGSLVSIEYQAEVVLDGQESQGRPWPRSSNH